MAHGISAGYSSRRSSIVGCSLGAERDFARLLQLSTYRDAQERAKRGQSCYTNMYTHMYTHTHTHTHVCVCVLICLYSRAHPRAITHSFHHLVLVNFLRLAVTHSFSPPVSSAAPCTRARTASTSRSTSSTSACEALECCRLLEEKEEKNSFNDTKNPRGECVSV
jgi:hypothetical protein